MDFQKAETLNNRGFIQLQRERYADAYSFTGVRSQLGEPGWRRYISAPALNQLGGVLRKISATWIEHSKPKKVACSNKSSTDWGRFSTTVVPSWAQHFCSERVKLEAAIGYLQRAFDAVSKDVPFQYSFSAGSLGDALEQTGSLDKAEHFNQIAFRFADPKDTTQLASLTSTQAAIAERRGSHDQALSLYQKTLELAHNTPSILWQTYAALADVYSAKGDFQNADANYSKALSVIAANRADQLKSDYKITFLSNLIHFYQEYVTLLIQHGDSDRALGIADSSRASVLTEDLLGQSEPTHTSLISQLHKAATASHSVFLFYWLAPKQSYLWAITATECKAFPLPDQRQIDQEVASYRSLIEEQKRDPLAGSSPTGIRLFQELIGPVATFIPPGTRVVVVPDGALHNLNFETLLVSTPTPHYWIEDAIISVAPSLSILQAGKSVTPTERSLLLMGDPLTKGTGYPDLPEAAAEIAGIQRLFPATHSKVLTGGQAFVNAYFAAQPQKYSTIHFATHVDANAQSPLDSAIILSPQSDGFRLYARDVARTPLSADLVTISACHGAGASHAVWRGSCRVRLGLFSGASPKCGHQPLGRLRSVHRSTHAVLLQWCHGKSPIRASAPLR